MIDFKLDENNDLDISGNTFNLVSGGAEVAQSCAVRLRTIQGEYLYDFTAGVDWYGTLFVVAVGYDLKRQVLFDVVKNTKGFKDMIEFKFSIDYYERGALVEFNATAIYNDGDIEFSEGINL